MTAGVRSIPYSPPAEDRPKCECCGGVLMFSWERILCDECKLENGIPADPDFCGMLTPPPAESGR